MHWSEILAILFALVVLSIAVGIYIYRRVKKTPFITCECGKSQGRDLVKEYHKKYKNHAGCMKK